MGDLILFPMRRTPSRERRSGEAEILFFTGVRYQRMSEPAPTGASDDRPSQGARRKRKRG